MQARCDIKLLFLLFTLILFGCNNDNEILFVDDFFADDYAVENPYSEIALNENWQFASFSKINSGSARLYSATQNRKNFTVSVNAGHGTEGGVSVKTYSHPDKSPKIVSNTKALGAIESFAVSVGMTFSCGLTEAEVNLRIALILRKLLLENGYDVLMIRENDDVQLDNIARTVISNNNADIHIGIHFDGDCLNYDKGCFYCAVPDGLKYLENVKSHCENSENLGKCLIDSLSKTCTILGSGRRELDLMQTAYSTIPTLDIELGNQITLPYTAELEKRANAILDGINAFYKDFL